MRTTLSRAVRSLPLFVTALAIAGLLGDRPVFGDPQAGAAGSTVETELPAIQTLRLKETTAFAPPAPNAFGSGTACDSRGNVFFKHEFYDPTQMHVASGSDVSEVITDSKQMVAYGSSPLSASDYPNERLGSFSVRPNGAVYALIFTRRDPSNGGPRPAPEYYVERFNDDGTTDSIARIQTPPGATRWFAEHLAAFPDGNILIAGTASFTGGEPPNASSLQPFTAIYDPTGRFAREVALPDDVLNETVDSASPLQQEAKGATATVAGTAGMKSPGADEAGSTSESATQASPTQPSKPRELFSVAIATGGLVSGPDGNVWILRASDPMRLYAVDSAGEVAKHFEFSSPIRGLKPFSIGFAGPDMVFFDFAHFAPDPSPTSGPSKVFALFNTVSARFEGLYTLPDTEKGLRIPACGDRHGGFLFLGTTPDNHLGVFDYRP